MEGYNHSKIEKKWQKIWDKNKVYQASQNTKKKKFYSLIEFPYPSGDGLHVGHPRPYIGMDVISRKRRMQGYDVLYPIGWDAFGLPTENYAIKTGKDPKVVTKENSDNFRRQIKSLGISFDWSREINTTDPKYYKWTQWIFLQLLKKGLAYKAKIAINWCPKDKIGLANEEVIGGACERCGSRVEKREKEQWMLGITKYAERLDKDLDEVDFLPQIKLAQRNWIGKSEGAEIDFEIVGRVEKIKIFTTRPDTIFGATFLAVAPEVAKKLTGKDFGIKNDTDRENKDKEGKDTGLRAINPANKEEIPVWVVNYVSADYGTGAIMAVPAHDERDYEFAKKYKLSIRNVIEPLFFDNPKQELSFTERNAVHVILKHWSENKYLILRWKKVNWVTFVTGGIEEGETPQEAATREIKEETGYQNFIFKYELPKSHSKFFHIPKNKNIFAHFSNLYFELVDGEQVELSEEEKSNHELEWVSYDRIEDYIKIGGSLRDWKIFKKEIDIYTGEGLLVNSGKFDAMESEKARKEIIKFVGGKEKTSFKLRDWVFSRQRYWGEPIPVINCEKCGYVPVPEKDLPVKLPNVKNYQPTDSGESPLANISKWVNVKCPKCKGKAKRETDTMPNWAGSSWYYLRYADPKNAKTFADKKKLKYWTPVDWYNGGFEHTTLHLLYSRFWHKFLFDLGLVPTSEPYMKRTSHGIILAEGGEKMSKSRGNVINPDTIVKNFGADTLRVYEMFMGPFNQAISWSDKAIIGPRRFLERVWKLFSRDFTEDSSLEVSKVLNKTIDKVSGDIEEMNFNTAISSLMILSTEMQNAKNLSQNDFKKFLQILAPFAPHLADELWQKMGEKKSIQLSSWPLAESVDLGTEKKKIIIQVNGKVRSEIFVEGSLGEEDIKSLAIKDPGVSRHVGEQKIKRIIYVKDRLVNIVL